MLTLHKITFDTEPDLVNIRRVARTLAQLVGFEQRDEVKITAAVSELTRAAGTAPGGGAAITFSLDDDVARPRLVLDVAGPGLAPALRRRGGAVAESIVAAEKLLELEASDRNDAAVRFVKPLPVRAPVFTRERVAAIRADLKRLETPRPGVSREELRLQSHELAAALLDVEERKAELTTLNAELSDTNRGVVALYAELDERANHLRRADELKTRFFSHMSHEFRTPLNSILALSNILLEESDGPLTDEQRRQVSLIRNGVADLLDLVGDLLDLAKMDAGKTRVAVAEFSVGTLFGALRAMIRPLLGTPAVTLEFGTAVAQLPPLVSDESKITQILRNFLSNAAKFTERGTIAVDARLLAAGDPVAGDTVDTDSVLFSVADTGIGIAPQHHAAIFEEFQQVENRLQRKSRGSGLGLPLCRRLANLLGGRVWVESEQGRGATFYLLVPRVHGSTRARQVLAADVRPRLLIVDERERWRSDFAALFREGRLVPIESSPNEIGAAGLAALSPAAALVGTETPPTTVATLRDAGIPVLREHGTDISSPAARDRVVADAHRAVLHAAFGRILVVDDDEAYRTILTRQLAPFCRRIHAVDDPRMGLTLASARDQDTAVDCIVLDLLMPEMDGFTMLQRLRSHDETAALPAVVCSSKTLSAEDHAQLRRLHAAFIAKDQLAESPVAQALLDAQRLAELLARERVGSAA